MKGREKTESGRDVPEALERVIIKRPDLAIPVGSNYRLLALGLGASGDTLPLSAEVLEWSVSDTAIATIDQRTGDLGPRRTGTVTVLVSAGGWRQGSETIDVTGAEAIEVLNESWVGGLRPPWVEYGSPLPQIELSSDGTMALNNNGDGSYSSGVYTGTSFSAARGLGLEARTWLLRTRNHWQVQNVGLIPDHGFSSFGEWDHRTKAGPFQKLVVNEGCQVALGGEGPFAQERGYFSAGASAHSVPLPPTMLGGEWHDLRLQLFPDGTCGIAIDGKALWQSRSTIPTNQRYRLLIDGNAARTKMLIGPLTVWEGVKGGVDWKK